MIDYGGDNKISTIAMDTNDNILGADAGLAGIDFDVGGEEELHNNNMEVQQQQEEEQLLPNSSSLGDLGPSDQQLALDDPTSQLHNDALQSAAMLAVDPILAQQEVMVTDNVSCCVVLYRFITIDSLLTVYIKSLYQNHYRMYYLVGEVIPINIQAIYDIVI